MTYGFSYLTGSHVGNTYQQCHILTNGEFMPAETHTFKTNKTNADGEIEQVRNLNFTQAGGEKCTED